MSDQTTELAEGYTAERNKHGTAILHANGGVHIASVCELALIGEIDRLRAQVAAMREDVARYEWLRTRVPGGTYRRMGVFYGAASEISAAIDRARESGGQG